MGQMRQEGQLRTLRETGQETLDVLDRLVARVRTLVAESVDDQELGATDLSPLLQLDGLHVRDVAERSDPIADDGQSPMCERNRGHPFSEEFEGGIYTFLDRVELEARGPWVRIGTEDVVHASLHRVKDSLLPVDGDVFPPSDGTDIIEPKRVIVVLMRQQDRIDSIDPQPCRLVVEVRTAVDEDPMPRVGDDQSRGA